MEHGLLEDAKAQEKAHKAFMKRKTAPNTKSSIAGTVQPRRYLDEIKNNAATTTAVKKETSEPTTNKPASAVKREREEEEKKLESSAMKRAKAERDEESSDDDVPLAKLAAQKA